METKGVPILDPALRQKIVALAKTSCEDYSSQTDLTPTKREILETVKMYRKMYAPDLRIVSAIDRQMAGELYETFGR